MAKKKKTSRGRSASRKASAAPVTESLERSVRQIYRPVDIALGVAKLFPGKQGNGWKNVASDKGYLRIRPAVSLGVVGLCGSLALGNPPSPDDIDAWEASKPANCWDYWDFLDFVSVPAAGKKGGINVVLFHARDSFQQAPLQILGEVYLKETEHERSCADRSLAYDEQDEPQSLKREWSRLRAALELRYGTTELRKQTWTVDGKAYDITFPDP